MATRYLGELHGIEIGASTQNSFELRRAINVDFVDQADNQQQGCPPAVVHVVALGDKLPFQDATLDYVVSSHVIEHFYDPVKALREWYRVIQPGGYIFVIAPHRDRTFDHKRVVTPLQELIDRSTGRVKLSDYAMRPGERVEPGKPDEREPQFLVRDKAAAKMAEGWPRFTSDTHHHWSVWRTDDFLELVRWLKFEVVEVQDVDDKIGNGFTVVIRK